MEDDAPRHHKDRQPRGTRASTSRRPPRRRRAPRRSPPTRSSAQRGTSIAPPHARSVAIRRDARRRRRPAVPCMAALVAATWVVRGARVPDRLVVRVQDLRACRSDPRAGGGIHQWLEEPCRHRRVVVEQQDVLCTVLERGGHARVDAPREAAVLVRRIRRTSGNSAATASGHRPWTRCRQRPWRGRDTWPAGATAGTSSVSSRPFHPRTTAVTRAHASSRR